MSGASLRTGGRVYNAGQPLRRHVELCPDQFGIPECFLLHRLPVHSPGRKTLGLEGVFPGYENPAGFLPQWGDIARAVTFIRHNYMRAISITEVSRAVFMSVRQLQRKFKRILDIGPHEFLIQTRVLAACRMLQQTNHSLTDVALACGFFDQSAFGRHFRKHVGITPARFRYHCVSEPPLRNRDQQPILPELS